MKACFGWVLQECRKATGPTVETRHDFGLCVWGPRLLTLPGSHWNSTHCLWSSCTSRRSKSHFLFFMIICSSRLLFHRREGRGEQSSLACKEIWTETSSYLAVNRAVFDKETLKSRGLCYLCLTMYSKSINSWKC